VDLVGHRVHRHGCGTRSWNGWQWSCLPRHR
jgi:hypothetical protein